MKIAIIGAGAVGVTTAHTLNKAGCEVQVFELGSSAAQGASFAHSGVFGPAGANPFFTSKFTQHWAMSLLGRPKNIHWATLSKAGDYGLGIKAAWQSRRLVLQTTAQALERLGAYSASVGARYLSGKRLEFEQGSGLMVLHSQTTAFEAASLQAKALNSEITATNKKIKILTAQETFDNEPALAQHTGLLGAIVYPSESYGNCALFTKQLKSRHQKNGVQYWFNTQVLGLETHGQQWRVHTQARPGTLAAGDANDVAEETNASTSSQLPQAGMLFDAVIVAAGAGSSALLTPLGLSCPTLKTHAYNVTLPMHERIDSPSLCVLDAATGNTLTPIGNRIRVSGQHQLGAAPKQRSPAYKALGQTIQHWYPFASKVSEASYDVSSSCIATDSKPIVGRTRLPGLHVNFAHGDRHWALSFGCAQALADELMNETDKFDLTAFSPFRFD